MNEPFVLLGVALSGFGAALGLYFAAAALLGRSAGAARVFLAAFCACFALLMLGDIADAAIARDPSHWSGNALDWVFLLLPPLFYFYVFSLIAGEPPRAAKVLTAFAPAALYLLWWAGQVVATRGVATAAAGDDFMPASYTLSFVGVAAMLLLAYGVAALLLVRRHASQIKQQYSAVQGINLAWVQALIAAAAMGAVVWLAGIFIQHPVWVLVSAAVPIALMLLLGVWALRQAPLQATLPTQAALDEPAPAAAKYAKSGLDAPRMQALAAQLEAFMANEKAFLEGDLTLGELSRRINAPPHQLSQLLNQHLGCSFFDYISALRVGEAQRCLTDPAYRSQTVLEIGLAAGFNSKAAFNSAFKRHTGTTPSSYRTRAP